MKRPHDLRRFLAPGALAVGAAGLVSVLASGCAPRMNDGPQVADPQRRAESEYDLARDAFYKGHLREALDHSQRANKLDDQNAKALYFTAAVYLGFCAAEGMASPDCRLASAEEFTRRAIKVEPEFRDAKNTLGQVLIHEKKYEEALKVLEPLTKDPAYGANYLAWANYGEALVALGKVDEGIAALRNSITQPRFCTGHYRLGVAYEKKGNLAAAEQSFTDAVDVPSADCQALQDAWFERAQVRLKLGKTVEAQGDFARCREIGATTETGKECARLAGGSAPTPLQPLVPPAGSGANAQDGTRQDGTQQEATTSASQ
jgi:type IV pilus assembly protein PilF